MELKISHEYECQECGDKMVFCLSKKPGHAHHPHMRCERCSSRGFATCLMATTITIPDVDFSRR